MRDAGEVVRLLREHGIQPSAQRVAVARWVLDTESHPSADEVWAKVRARFPMVSRATVYNTLHTLVAEGLLRELVLAEGKVVYDPKVDPHHHFIDDETGAITDVAWDALKVQKIDALQLQGFDVREYQVVMRGKTSRKA